ncbi:MAG: hypothetical protein IT342_02500 [Candidatus Melainabacteria bacterium]|nr:hypothetical protein [Candidatus Melainabacteria bacterium]
MPQSSQQVLEWVLKPAPNCSTGQIEAGSSSVLKTSSNCDQSIGQNKVGKTERFDLVTLSLIVALLSALYLVLPENNCQSCTIAESIQPLPGLKWVGISTYAAVLLGRLRFGWKHWLKGALLALLGAHICLAVYLIQFQILCLPCIICALSITAGAAILLFRKQVSWQFAAVVVSTSALAFAGASALASKVERINLENAIKESIGYANLHRQPGSGLTLYAFTVPNCRHCRDFEQTDLKAVKDRFGDRVTVSFHPAPPKLHNVPVLILAGKEKMLIVGRPRKTEKLIHMIDKNLAADSRL